MKRILYFIAITFLIVLITLSCGDEPIPEPDAVVLSSPANNSACLKGSSETGTIATVTFTWNEAANADSYVLEIKNLQTEQTTSYTTTALTYSATLSIGTHYSWSVTSVNTTGRTTGSVWKFYLAGVAASNYAPFPAELTAPASGAIINANEAASVQVSFSWKGSDVDNDIASYAFYLDNADATTQVIASQTENTTTQTLQSGKNYFWKVVTTDKVGNKSNSMISSFQIK